MIEFTDQSFEQEVIQSEMPVLVDFWAEWCPPCKMLTPTIEKLSQHYSGKIKIGKVNSDLNSKSTSKYGISSLPTVLLFHKGEVVKTIVGLKSEKDYIAILDPYANFFSFGRPVITAEEAAKMPCPFPPEEDL